MADRNLTVSGGDEAQRRVTKWERHRSTRRDGRRVQVVMAGSLIGCLLSAPALTAVAAEGRGRADARECGRAASVARGLRFAANSG